MRHSYGPVGALILGFIDDGFSGGDKTAFLHYASAGRVVNKVPGYKGFDVGHTTDMFNHQLQRFRANTSVPVRFCYPIADKRLAVTGRQIALARRAVAHGTDSLPCFL